MDLDTVSHVNKQYLHRFRDCLQILEHEIKQ